MKLLKILTIILISLSIYNCKNPSNSSYSDLVTVKFYCNKSVRIKNDLSKNYYNLLTPDTLYMKINKEDLPINYTFKVLKNWENEIMFLDTTYYINITKDTSILILR